jgi:VIT1/CCC1 family predicted Fe2+/Mn2+ transporter
MGAQDNLTNVLAVMLGVAIGAGRAELVALAGASAAVAEAISMGGVLYSATRAAERAERHELPGGRERAALRPVGSGLVCFGASLVAGLIPLLPFAALPLGSAIVVSVITSVVALFILGAWTGRIGGAIWWHDGVRLVIVGSAAAIAAAAVGTLLHI